MLRPSIESVDFHFCLYARAQINRASSVFQLCGSKLFKKDILKIFKLQCIDSGVGMGRGGGSNLYGRPRTVRGGLHPPALLGGIGKRCKLLHRSLQHHAFLLCQC